MVLLDGTQTESRELIVTMVSFFHCSQFQMCTRSTLTVYGNPDIEQLRLILLTAVVSLYNHLSVY